MSEQTNARQAGPEPLSEARMNEIWQEWQRTGNPALRDLMTEIRRLQVTLAAYHVIPDEMDRLRACEDELEHCSTDYARYREEALEAIAGLSESNAELLTQCRDLLAALAARDEIVRAVARANFGIRNPDLLQFSGGTYARSIIEQARALLAATDGATAGEEG